MIKRLKSRAELEAWIAACRARGWWAIPCWALCGEWFAQDRHRKGRRAQVCTKKRCILALRWQTQYGRAPPQALRDLWRKRYGDAVAEPSYKRLQSPERVEVAA